MNNITFDCGHLMVTVSVHRSSLSTMMLLIVSDEMMYYMLLFSLHLACDGAWYAIKRKT